MNPQLIAMLMKLFGQQGGGQLRTPPFNPVNDPMAGMGLPPILPQQPQQQQPDITQMLAQLLLQQSQRFGNHPQEMGQMAGQGVPSQAEPWKARIERGSMVNGKWVPESTTEKSGYGTQQGKTALPGQNVQSVSGKRSLKTYGGYEFEPGGGQIDPEDSVLKYLPLFTSGSVDFALSDEDFLEVMPREADRIALTYGPEASLAYVNLAGDIKTRRSWLDNPRKSPGMVWKYPEYVLNWMDNYQRPKVSINKIRYDMPKGEPSISQRSK